MITNELLQALLSSDASRRQAAESHLASLTVHARIEGWMRQLQLLSSSGSTTHNDQQPLPEMAATTTHLAAVLLRRDILQLTQPMELQSLVDSLLSLLLLLDRSGSTHHASSLQRPQINKAIYDCLGQVGSSLQILNMSAAVETVTEILKNQPTNLSLWTVVAQSAPKVFYQSNAWTHVPSLLVSDGNGVERLALVVATLQAAPEASLTLPRNIPLLQHDPRVLDLLLQAAESTPRLFIGRTMDLLVPVIEQHGLSGVQLLVQLLQHDGAWHEFGSAIPAAMSQCWIELVSSHHCDDRDWNVEPDDDDEDENETFAQVLMASLARYPGALPWLWSVLEQAIHNEHTWLAAIMALEAAWDGAPLGSMEHVQTAITVALAAPPLCGAAIRLLGLICQHTTLTDLPCGSDASVVVIVKRLVEACGQPHTALWACAALSTMAQSKFIVNADDDNDNDLQQQIITITSFLPDVLTALAGYPMSAPSSNDVKVQALVTVASWATIAGERFRPFYSQWVPTLLQMISTTTTGGDGVQLDNSNNNETLASACLETVTIIGQAVPDAFLPDAQRILDSISFDGTLQPSFVFVACARIASVVKEAYTPFLNRIIPQLLSRLNDPASDLEFSAGDWQASEEVAGDSVTVAVPGKGLQKVTINTSKIQERILLARAVYEHVVAVGSSYGPYCQGSLETLLPLVEFQYSADVRGTAAQTVAALFEAACMAGEESGSMSIPKAFLSRTLDALSGQLESEDTLDMEVYFAVADAQSDVARMMYLYGPAKGANFMWGVEEKHIDTFVSRSMKYLSACLKRRSELTTKRSAVTGADLVQEIDDALRKEEDLLTPLVDSVGWLLKTYRDGFLSIFERLVVPVLGVYLHSGNDVRATLSSVCLFDDCIEFCGPSAASKYAPMLLQGVLRGLSKDVAYGNDADLKRASIYGVAQMARHAPTNVLEPHARWIVQELSQIASNRELYDEAIYENAISALASLLLFHNAPFARSGFLKRDLVLQHFLSALPLTIDPDEAKICHAGLCDLAESGENIDLLLLSAKAYEILTKVQEDQDVATPETCNRLHAIICHCQQHGGHFGSSCASNIVSP